jgi:hypothetical protein
MSLLIGRSDGDFVGRNRRTGRYKRGHPPAYYTKLKLLKEALAALYGAYMVDTPADQLIAALAAHHIVAAGKARSTVRRVAESRCADRWLSRLKPRAEASPLNLKAFGL